MRLWSLGNTAVKTNAEYKADERERMRARGYVLRHLWVHPEDWERVKKYIAAIRRRRESAADEGN